MRGFGTMSEFWSAEFLFNENTRSGLPHKIFMLGGMPGGHCRKMRGAPQNFHLLEPTHTVSLQWGTPPTDTRVEFSRKEARG